MPEYLAPGVFVEEVSFRAKSIEGVPTSTTGFVGIAPFGPVQYPAGPVTSEPRLVTSFPEFERTYGKLDLLLIGGDQRLPYLAHAARAFFLNGGQRLYVSRVFVPTEGDAALGVASVSVPIPTPTASTAAWRARWPGSMGNVAVTTSITRSRDVANHSGSVPFANMAREGSIVEVVPSPGPLPAIDNPLDPDNLRIVGFNPDGTQTFTKADGTQVAPAVSDLLSIIELSVLVSVDADRSDASSRLGTDPSHLRFVGKILALDHPEDQDSVVWLDYDFDTIPGANAISLLVGLVGAAAPGLTMRLISGNDGALPGADDFNGQVADPDDRDREGHRSPGPRRDRRHRHRGPPDAAALGDPDEPAGHRRLPHRPLREVPLPVRHHRRRPGSSVNEIREFRGNFDSTYAALYHPWLEILDPTSRRPRVRPRRSSTSRRSGAMAGIYGRTDIDARRLQGAGQRGGLRAHPVRDRTSTRAATEVLNPEGINALRFFQDRGNRVWGARTMSSDPEWKYVNVRRLFIYLEHSIDKGTQWAVFEPNNESLWAQHPAQSIKDFLEVQWRAGALLGTSAEQAYFVRCDRTTMTQNDLDNGRLICLIGVAPTCPAEFVIFRIGQWTADATTS